LIWTQRRGDAEFRREESPLVAVADALFHVSFSLPAAIREFCRQALWSTPADENLIRQHILSALRFLCDSTSLRQE
jgi:hypothetical protein